MFETDIGIGQVSKKAVSFRLAADRVRILGWWGLLDTIVDKVTVYASISPYPFCSFARFNYGKR